MPSDLDFVAQAMAASNGTSANSQAPAAANTADAALPDDIAAQLASLSPQERQAMQPLIDALITSSGSDGGELSEREISDLLRQMDAAEGVAEDLEKKLDALLSEVEGLQGTQEQQSAVENGASASKEGQS